MKIVNCFSVSYLVLAVLLLPTLFTAAAENVDQNEGALRISPSDLNSLIGFQYQEELESLYKLSGNQLIWSEADGTLTSQSFEAIQSLQLAYLMGLKPEKYAASHLLNSWNELKTPTLENISDLAGFDVALSASLMQFISDLHLGQIDPLKTGLNVVISQKRVDLVESVFAYSRSQNIQEVIQNLEPRFIAYQRLKKALSHYRQLANDYQWKPLLDKKTINPGHTYQDLDILQGFLIAVGDLDPLIPENGVYDGEIVEAVKRFQRRHGLEDDGLIGRKTFRQLNTPLSQRVEQIELALERLRWLPVPNDGPHIVVNIPAFELYAFDVINALESIVLKMDVIVGSTLDKHETPIFIADMKYLVFRPYWYVPYSITVEELLPKLELDPAYLNDHHYEILEGHTIINTSSGFVDQNMLAQLRSGKLRIRQKPGKNNALGLIKFIFPNSNSIYLHDTPARQLFSQSRRDFSHGCIRVEDPIGLSEFILNQQNQDWSRAAIGTAIQGRNDQKVILSVDIPVYIFYTTAIVRENGDIAFFDDIYGHDNRLGKLLRSSSLLGNQH